MKKLLIVLGSFVSTMVMAQGYGVQEPNGGYGVARVVNVEPQYTIVNQPKQVCHNEIIQQSNPGYVQQDHGGAVLGGVAGALLGSQVGGGNGRLAATALGAVGGMLAGNSMDSQGATVTQPSVTQQQVQRCVTENQQTQVLNGYKVTYEYNGKLSSYISPKAPPTGQIQVNIQTTPIINY
jgi:uncharacterized protein YcfJ